jgi:hypothetical protein
MIWLLAFGSKNQTHDNTFALGRDILGFGLIAREAVGSLVDTHPKMHGRES